ncbi:hypothetical protein Aca07nite_26170 [Actinoplanes capillaceus]|uniref:Uncharacterized protein n=1 Tax=Actinoplanes campanulatus TaxID=113559 RepID=A0ABQ3WE91_9ACTN|nr:hypothetical protein Aca07nite_26170 [Actinoplanes capillaceus]
MHTQIPPSAPTAAIGAATAHTTRRVCAHPHHRAGTDHQPGARILDYAALRLDTAEAALRAS